MSAALAETLFVVLEGLDGAGKTTCASMLAEMLGAACMTTPSSQVRQYRQQILDSFGTSQEAAQLFYLSTVFAASNQVGATLASGKSVVMDRYFLSTQAYAEFRGSRLPLDAINSLLVPAHLTVYLNASPDIRRQRLQDRGCTAEDRATLSCDAYPRLDALHRQKASLPVVGCWLEIDNSGPDPRAAVQCILAAIEKMAGAR
jgi:dTMP kinase